MPPGGHGSLAVPPGSAAGSLARLDERIAAGEVEVPKLDGPPVTRGVPEETQRELAEELVRAGFPSLADTLDDAALQPTFACGRNSLIL